MTISENSKIVLQPYKNEHKAFSSVAPASWMPIAPGIHIQRSNGNTLLQTAFPTTNVSGLLASLMSNTGIRAMPIAVDIREANDFLWKLYRASDDRRTVDVGLAQAYGNTYIVLLQSNANQDEAVMTKLFLSVIDHFATDVATV